MENKTEYLSLYDFLGKAAGEQLGKEVWIAAAKANIPTELREISNPKYTGKVVLYPKDFLDFYFREPSTESLSNQYDKEYEEFTKYFVGYEDIPTKDWFVHQITNDPKFEKRWGKQEDDELPF